MSGDFSLTLLIELALALSAAGIFAGVLAGLFGVGGGVILVPVLFEVFGAIGVGDDVRMHLALGTSLATIMLTSLRSVHAHHKRDAVDWEILKTFAPATALGVIAGGIVAAHVSGDVLKAVFAVLALLIGAQLGFGHQDWRLLPQVPKGVFAHLVTFIIGVASALMGIGGGTFAVLSLTLCGVSIHRAVATAAGLGFVIAVPGAISYAVAGWGAAGLPPFSLGYVSAIGFALIAPATMIAAPWGAHLAHRLSRLALRRAFAVSLALTALRMFVSLLA